MAQFSLPSSLVPALSSPEWANWQPLRNQFEAAWQRGERPDLKQFLPAVPALWQLVDLCAMDLEFRLKAGESARVEEYLLCFPELGQHAGALAQLIRVEFVQRRHRGEAVTPEEYFRRYPLLSAAAFAASLGETLLEIPASQKPATVADAPNIPGYEILDVLGRGGMGVVYRALDVKLQRVVALKVLQTGSHAQPDILARFLTEAEVVARLQHPGIVPVYEFSEHQGRHYFTMEYCPGGSLHQKLRDKPLPPREAARLVEVVARAMHAVHQVRVLHRDLKPANVLLTAAEQPKVADFGLAKKLDAQGPTLTPQILGTPSYMSPEQASGKTKTLTEATDVYSLGAVLYECLTGRPPFAAAEIFETLHLVLHTEPTPPKQLQPGTPRDLNTICLKCLEKAPRKRYASAAALADDLQRYREDQPILARPVGTVERTWRWCRRKPALAVTGGAALLAVVLLFVTLSVAFFLVRESRDEARNLARKEKEQRFLAEQGRKQAERLAVQLRLENAFSRCQENPAVGILALAQLFQAARELQDAPLEASLQLHLGHWSQQVHPLRWLFNHPSKVFAVAFSPDGKTVLTGSADKTARLWEAANGRPLGQPLQHQGKVYAVAFSPDSKTVLTGSADKTARLWDAASGNPLGKPLQHQGQINVVAFSPDGQTVLTGSVDTTARLWETANGQQIGKPLQHQSSVQALTFSPDGKTVLTGSADQTTRLWEVASGQQIGKPVQHQDPIMAVAFSPNGKMVVTGSADKTARLWEAVSGKPLGKPLQHQGPINAVAFSPDGQTVLTGSADKTARLWEAASGRQIGPALQHRGPVDAVAFGPDGKTVLTGSADKTVRLWEIKPFGLPLQHQGQVVAVAFSPDGKTVLTGSHDRTARLWKAANGQQIGKPLQHQSSVQALTFSPDGKTVLTGSADQTARLWEVASGQQIGKPLQHQGPIIAVAFSPNGKMVVTGSADKTARLWEAVSGKPLGKPLQHQGPINAVAFSPDGQTVLTGSADKTARLWEAASGRHIGNPLQHQDQVYAVAFSPDGKTALTGSADKTARLWKAASGKPLGKPLQHQDGVEAVAFSSDSKTVLTGSADKTARLWEAASGQHIGFPMQHQSSIRAVAFNPDGKIVLTGSEDTTARLWEAASGKPIRSPLGHLKGVRAVAFSPDGKAVLTGSEDATARLWQVSRPLGGAPKQLVLWTQVITGLELAPQGVVHVLDAATWSQRHQSLQARGGPQ